MCKIKTSRTFWRRSIRLNTHTYKSCSSRPSFLIHTRLWANSSCCSKKSIYLWAVNFNCIFCGWIWPENRGRERFCMQRHSQLPRLCSVDYNRGLEKCYWQWQTLVLWGISVLVSLCLQQIPHRLPLNLLGHDRLLPNTFKAIHLQIRYHIVSDTPSAIR